MQYRHVFHAGNFADVHKHIALLQLIEALQRKAKGFLYLDTHAGEGLYDLQGTQARHGAESESGIARLEAAVRQAPGTHDAIRHYLATVAAIRRAHGNGRNLYPGSPLLALAVLREVDAAVCAESQAPAARALQRALEHAAALAPVRPRVFATDGYRQVRSQLPPSSRRGLILIDPPHEDAAEEQLLTAALAEGLARFETGVFAVWYPIKKQHDAALWLARVTRGITRPTLAAEFCLHKPDHGAGLNGSGLLVVNPPWRFGAAAQAWQAQLERLLGGTGGSHIHWLVREQQV